MIVIGAGVAGLACAIHLARAGEPVTVLDRADPGGRARSAEIGGAVLNLGPHALYARSELASLLDRLGVHLPGGVPSGGFLARGGALSPLPASPIAALGAPLLAGQRWRALLTLARLGAAPTGASFGAWLDERGLTGGPRDLLVALARTATYVASPERLDARRAAAQIQLAIRGVRYLDGGWQRLVDALVAEATRLGVEVRPHVEALAVRRAGDGIEVETRQGTLAARGVALAVPPRAEAHLLGVEVPPTEPARIAALDLVLSSLPRPERTFAMGVDAPRYLSVHSRWARLAEDDRVVLHAAAYLDPGEVVAREVVEAWVDEVQPGWRDQVVHARWAPQLLVSADVPSCGRARLPVEVAPGVARAGEHVGDRALLADAAAASAEDAARVLLRRRGVRAA